MAINVADVFVIDDIPKVNGCYWSVTWPKYGRVSKLTNQAKLVSAAVHSTYNTIGISLANNKVCWISPHVFLESRMSIEDLVDHLQLNDAINGFAFVDRVDAEKFVEAAEQMIIMNLLTRDHEHD